VENTVRAPALLEKETRGIVWGEFALGDRRLGYRGSGTDKRGPWHNRDEPHTIFVDRLSTSTSKRVLYKKFGRFGYITDVFFSRKKRMRAVGLFAFIRYSTRGGALNAIGTLNGMSWENNQILVTMSKFQRNGGVRSNIHQGNPEPKKMLRVTQKWVEVNKRKEIDDKARKNEETKDDIVKVVRKEVEGIWAENQMEMLQRSLMGVCVKPIDLRKIRDAAFEDQLLQSIFDELRPHWGVFWCLSRRVWVEVTGMPVCIWCPKKFNRIAKLWGKPIRQDDISEEFKSFTTARILIDSYQWELIHEWVSVKIGDKVFEVFVKEFGSEVYNVQSHPDRAEGCSDSSEATMEDSMPVSGMEKSANVEDLSMSIGCGILGFDPMIIEPQTVVESVADPVKKSGRFNGLNEPSPDNSADCGLNSSYTCPYPPGFGLCTNNTHVHRDEARAPNSPNLVRETQLEDIYGVVSSPIEIEDPELVRGENAVIPSEVESRSSETLYCINKERFGESLFVVENREVEGVCWIRVGSRNIGYTS
ncbi:hypothetical protein PIB30_098683, partial [Stylosanthes scabra]|nr:hypothetical protein [Stylosanthes scabra]